TRRGIMRPMITVHRPLRRFEILLLAGLSCMAGGCESSTGLGREDFMIRFPHDQLEGTPPSFTASAISTDSIHFAWEPAPGARDYTVVFWRSASQDSMNRLEADLSAPAFELQADPTTMAEIRYGRSQNPDDQRRITVVQYDAPLTKMAATLAAAGMPPGEPLYFVWTVFAEAGGERWRTPHTKRMQLYLE